MEKYECDITTRIWTVYIDTYYILINYLDIFCPKLCMIMILGVFLFQIWFLLLFVIVFYILVLVQIVQYYL